MFIISNFDRYKTNRTTRFSCKLDREERDLKLDITLNCVRAKNLRKAKVMILKNYIHCIDTVLELLETKSIKELKNKKTQKFCEFFKIEIDVRKDGIYFNDLNNNNFSYIGFNKDNVEKEIKNLESNKEDFQEYLDFLTEKKLVKA